ncbi:bifunctional phosphoribosylaminoimidazolecarboxamide formyltransferase/IMP cyclohydrolase [Halosquirtibacter xylanolyticus]|uniref:bifunctional phosphoribosylaminoimidazolecarboxamide formyltransferase/IMP cyclohydrolase n=1 Tax=Halosquirtibacter xylanolyticus TaxID=3374599 RepID=UPI003748A8A2|nr:bifunctional phosphoribosylaminoimidazolecarboxamide formyltransferase/IMP cyclohydrolase [Prolixibacteraceae bacterium]
MDRLKSIRKALISVFDKTNLEPLVRQLALQDVEIFSTGGTQKFIEDLGISVTAVEDLTSYPSILGGRVKTLHPKVFGGILSRRDHEGDQKEVAAYEIPFIDLVVVDLYPFEETVASGASEADIIEKIDIGGISLIRAAAKNFKDVAIVSHRDQYVTLLDILKEKDGATSLADRKKLAGEAFAVSSHYDTAIHDFFAPSDGESLRLSYNQRKPLRYGENPHQDGTFYGDFDLMFDQLHGKEISYNNLLDIDAAVNLIDEFDSTTFAIMKHNNACGCASRDNLKEAYVAALSSDPVSAFGGILITNKKMDVETAEEVTKLFFEVIIAPSYEEDALKVLSTKKNRIILVRKETETGVKQYRSVLNGMLVQDKDLKQETVKDLTLVTKRAADDSEVCDLLFANRLVKQTKSNTIVLAKGDMLISSGVGETSRVDALKQAIDKAKNFGFDLNGVVMASDAFFPFADCVEIANKEGIKCVIQPGGSIRDNDSIQYCDQNDMTMVMTGFRHFKH